MKLTPWYPGSVKPVRVGVYERDFAEEYNLLTRLPAFARWDGEQWHCAYFEIALAEKDGAISENQSLPWRGVKK